MQLRNTATHFGLIASTLHWLTVVLVIVAWSLGTFGDELPKGTARTAGLFLHISAGLAILLLVFVRTAWRTADPPPPLEPTLFGAWGDRASHIAHYTLYVLLASVSIIGIALQFARGNALPIFGLFEVSSPWSADRAFARSVKEIHEFLANALAILAALHAAIALAHHWIFRNTTLLRMLPWFATKTSSHGGSQSLTAAARKQLGNV